MKFGFRIPSITKRIAARTSVKRGIRHNLWIQSPERRGLDNRPQESFVQ